MVPFTPFSNNTTDWLSFLRGGYTTRIGVWEWVAWVPLAWYFRKVSYCSIVNHVCDSSKIPYCKKSDCRHNLKNTSWRVRPSRIFFWINMHRVGLMVQKYQVNPLISVCVWFHWNQWEGKVFPPPTIFYIDFCFICVLYLLCWATWKQAFVVSRDDYWMHL